MVSKRWPSLSENQPYHLSSGNHWTALLFFLCLPFDNMLFFYSGICVEESTLSPILCSCEAFISFGAVYFSLPFLFCAMWIAIRSAPCECLCWPFFFLTQVLGLCPEVVCVWFLLQTRQAYHTRCTFKAKAGLVAQCLCYGNRFITNSK